MYQAECFLYYLPTYLPTHAQGTATTLPIAELKQVGARTNKVTDCLAPAHSSKQTLSKPCTLGLL